MKNLHVLPTEKFNLLGQQIWIRKNGGYFKPTKANPIANNLDGKVNVYITNEEAEEGDWVLNIEENTIFKPSNDEINDIKNSEAKYYEYCKKIILTTDPDLIADGVQAIDDEFLEWFVNNPSCESVETYQDKKDYGSFQWYSEYKIIMPKEEPKPEFCDNCNNDVCCCIIKERRMYSEEEVSGMLRDISNYVTTKELRDDFVSDYHDWLQKRDWFLNYLIEQAKNRINFFFILVYIW